MVLFAELNETITISCKLYDGATDQYPQAKIYDSDGLLLVTKNLVHMTSGIYTSTWSKSTEGYYVVDYIVYSESSYTTKNTDYDEVSEVIWVTEAYGGGGGGGHKIYTMSTRKSPWKQWQIETVVNGAEETIKLINGLSKDIDKKQKELLKKIDNISNTLASRIDNLSTSLKTIRNNLQSSINSIGDKFKDSTTKADSLKLLDGINNTIKMLDEYNSEVKTLSSESEYHELQSEIDKLAKMVATIMSDDDLESLSK